MNEQSPALRYTTMLVEQVEIYQQTLQFLSAHSDYMTAGRCREALQRGGAALAAYVAENKTRDRKET
jgi:hypothetical protein